MKRELLMPYEEYRTLDHKVPFCYRLVSNSQHLFYFGAKHTYDATDQQFAILKRFWDEFIEKTEVSKSIVLIEGGARVVPSTLEQSIREGGEMHYIAYLAKQLELATASPEPPPKYRYDKLLELFSKELIAYYDFILVCYQWNRYKTKPDFETYVNRFLTADKKNSGWSDFDFSIEHMREIHREIFGTQFDENNITFISEALDPMGNMGDINRLSLFEESGLRDEFIVQEIEKYWKRGLSIFIIYGVSHAVVQENAIRDIVLS